MRNIYILYMPTGNSVAMVHYQDTIQNKVSQERIFKYIDQNVQNQLKRVFGNKPIAVWGSQGGPGNRSRFGKMKPGDDVLIVEGDTIKLLGKIAATTTNSDLSNELWKSLDGKESQPWELIYFIANPLPVELPFSKFKELFGYSPNWSLRGFTNVSDDKLKEFYTRYDDLYSVFDRVRQGQEVVEKKEPKPTEEDDQVELTTEDVEDLVGGEELSDHVKMQWLLVRLGLKSGSKVWIPKNDQKKIREQYKYNEFEDEFASGVDVGAKYVENIDVVWKEEFRIDAAFEIENSTSIYSGLLRFSDLKIVAPNSNYPLFIVAPLNRKNRVFEQVKRPTFRKLDFDKKVRYLSYEALGEVEKFFDSSEKGLNVETLEGKSEEVV